MTVIKRGRKAQTNSAIGRSRAMTEAANSNYPGWPKELVDLPSRRRDRQRSLGWFDHLLQHRVPAAWQPADSARVALLARTLTAWERETWLLQEREGGDAGLADKWRSAIGQFARQLGLSVAIRDPRLLANEAIVREETGQHQLELDQGDGAELLARPTTRQRLN